MMIAKFDISTLPPAPNFSFESDLWRKGVRFIAGIDEAGRGSLAGPVAAAALILPADEKLEQQLEGVRDSKEMTPEAREYWAVEIKKIALAWGVGFASHTEIDEIGIVPATYLAVNRAMEKLQVAPEHLLLDFINLPDCQLPQTSLVKGDARCLSIAAASVLAKTTRDELLCRLDAQYPGYGFASHKGYTTRAHREALLQLGPSPIHRLSFRLLREEEDEQEQEQE
jgi:ribonuclease HII